MEEFKTIEGFENYEVSNFGNIKNISTGRIYKYDRIGPYCTVFLKKDTITKRENVHGLVGRYFLPNPNNKLCVDHIDTDKTNNHISNLRWATKRENNCNKPLQKNNSSGLKGVYYDKRFNLWSAKIGHNNKLINLGSYNKKEDALKARLKGVLKIQGEYANQLEMDLIITLNIKTSSSTKKNIVVNLNIDDIDEEYEALEKELNELLTKK